LIDVLRFDEGLVTLNVDHQVDLDIRHRFRHPVGPGWMLGGGKDAFTAEGSHRVLDPRVVRSDQHAIDQSRFG
jgi:hypothetical protein